MNKEDFKLYLKDPEKQRLVMALARILAEAVTEDDQPAEAYIDTVEHRHGSNDGSVALRVFQRANFFSVRLHVDMPLSRKELGIAKRNAIRSRLRELLAARLTDKGYVLNIGAQYLDIKEGCERFVLNFQCYDGKRFE